ncbi:hypothetical protein [Okeania sp. SIO1F9]|uniref:hypothetical protein n=1 Tax=Okeania sp. SIO1F9 TaxID=2607813 RepID=UPI00144DA919|nr:hypothetical protein [Okeania sp. SIO1F9]NET76245.1 hypothetical protein [Okeania sp. SIO1F9]
MYDISLNSLGVNPPACPSQEGKSVGASQEGRKIEETPSRRRKSFGRVKVTEFYRALIRTWYHTSNYQRLTYQYLWRSPSGLKY